jgi:hypothetical protein
MGEKTFFHLHEQFAALRAEYHAKAQKLEDDWLKSCGIKPEDLYSPEERAERFHALLSACLNTKPETQQVVKMRAKVRRNAKKLEKQKAKKK